MDFSDVKEEVKRTADIVEIIGKYVQLKKRGQNYIGLCPFHSEKSPSFAVNQDKKIYHCFGCGRGGDVIKFWMEYHSLSFLQSLKDLANLYNITLPRYKNSGNRKKENELIDILFNVNNEAGRYFNDVLLNSAGGKPGRDYFLSRHLKKDTISEFKLGYTVDRWDGLVNCFKSKNIPLDKGEKAGLLVVNRKGRYYDRFRGRIMFPIFNLNGQIVGFGGRVLDDSLPKYINTPETPLFHKGSFLYGFNSAFSDIRKKDMAIIVEGYMDLLVLRQHGISNVVATLGTALTREQVRRLRSYTKEVITLFDSDKAGREAALRSFPLFLNEDISAKVLVLPDGEDPDSFVNKYGIRQFNEMLGQSTPVFDFYLDHALSQEGSDVEGKIKLLKDVLPIFLELQDGAKRLIYVHAFSEKTGINEGKIWEELKNRGKMRQGKINVSNLEKNSPHSQDTKKYGSDLQFLNLLVHYPEEIDNFKDQDWKLIVSDSRIVKIITGLMEQFKSVEDLYEIEQSLDDSNAQEQLREVSLSNPIYDRDSVHQAVIEFTERIKKIKISQSISKARIEGDIAMLNHLIKEKQKLDLNTKRN